MRIERVDNRYRVVREGDGGRLRIALLCSDDPQHEYLRQLLADAFNLVGVIVEPGRAQQRKLWRRGRYLDWGYRGYHVLRQRITGRSGYRRRYFHRPGAPAGGGRPELFEVDDVGSDQAIALLRRLRPHLTVVCGTTYLPERLTRNGGLMINVHGGALPDYKGNHCVFFAFLLKDYARIAATLHIVSGELDGGDIIDVVRPEIFPHDNDEHLYCRCLHAGMLRLRELLTSFESGTAQILASPQPVRGRMYRHRNRKPHLDLYLWLRRILRAQTAPHLPARRGLSGRQTDDGGPVAY